MAFTWNSITTGEIFDYDDYLEIRQNINTVADKLPGSPGDYTWSYGPSAEDVSLAVEIQELRDATDWLDNNNVCNSDNTSHYGIDDGTQNATENADYDSGINSDYDGTYDNDQNTGYDGGHDYGVDGAQYSTRYGSERSGHNGTYNSGYYSNNYGSDLGSTK